MDTETDFESIRPYFDHEVREVVERLAEEKAIMNPVRHVFPHWTRKTLKNLLPITSISEFQEKIAGAVVRAVIERSTNGFTYSGLEGLQKDVPRLFISNHRDIVLDPSLINFTLLSHGFDTAQIGIGNNLLAETWVRDLVRINKSFIVHRDVSGRRMYDVLYRLSRYIRHVIHDLKSSVWIAQREGRAKDGNDMTQTGLLKMIGLSEKNDLLGYLKTLRITPLAVSYEYDPCDVEKALEIHVRTQAGAYEKEIDEDLRSIAKGMTGHKGHIHLSIAPPIQEALDRLKGMRRREQIRTIAGIIDEHIYREYRIWPSNYIAHDLLTGGVRYRERYTVDEEKSFIRYADERLGNLQEDREQIRRIFLSIYANPVKNRDALLDVS